jgi:hypothetical protein
MEVGPRRHRSATVRELSTDLSIKLPDNVLTVGLREPSDEAVKKENLDSNPEADGSVRGEEGTVWSVLPMHTA